MKTNANGCVRDSILWWFSSIIFTDLPKRRWRVDCNDFRRILKRAIIPSRKIHNYENEFITFGDRARNVKKIFEKLSEPALEICIENSVQSEKTGSRIFEFLSICIELCIQNFGASSGNFSNNFFTFRVLSPKVLNLFP